MMNQQSTKHAQQLPDGKFKVNKMAVLKTLLKSQRQREKVAKLASGDDDQGTIEAGPVVVFDESRSLQRYTADDMLNLKGDEEAEAFEKPIV
jgi:hypothetical protein